VSFGGHKLGASSLYEQVILLALSTALVAVWVYTKPIVFTYDTHSYIDFARQLQQGKAADTFFLRLPIYPAILWAFGVTDFSRSVFWLIVFQAGLAVLSVGLFYQTARLLEPRWAFAISLLFVASMLPFMQVKFIMTEQTFLFETMLALYGIVTYLIAPSNPAALRSAAILGLALALMMLTRPQGAYAAPLLLVLAAAFVWRRAWIPLMTAVLVFTGVWSVQILDKRLRAVPYDSTGNFDNTHATGKMLMFTFYLEAADRANIRIAPENGPATAEMKRILLEELVKPDTLARKRGYLATVPPDQVPALVDKIFNERDSVFLAMLSFNTFDERLGPKQADRLLLWVCLEAALANPRETAWLLFRKGLQVYLDPYGWVVPVHSEFPAGTFKPPLADEIAAAGDYSIKTDFDKAMAEVVRWLMRLTIAVALITLPFALRCRTRAVTITLLMFGLYLNMTIVIGNSPQFRYVIYAIPLNLICAYVGAVAWMAARRNRPSRIWPITGEATAEGATGSRV
jgi:hypothetical protein